MSEAPERIWLIETDKYNPYRVSCSTAPHSPDESTEYIRSDRIEAIEARLSEALREAQRVLILASKHRITIEPDTLKMIDAALSGSGPGWPVPDGWKLVPVEPDDAMIEAGQDTCEEKNSWGGRVYASDIWESMLAASPAAPQQGGELC